MWNTRWLLLLAIATLATVTVFNIYGVKYAGVLGYVKPFSNTPSKVNLERIVLKSHPATNVSVPKTKTIQGTKGVNNVIDGAKAIKRWKRPEDNPSYFKKRSTRVTPLDFNFLITSNICEGKTVDLVIILLSMTSHRKYRDAIRETWAGVNSNNTWAGKPLSMRVKLVFILGYTNDSDTKLLKKEAEDKHDLILTDVKEAYFHLTYKVLMGIKWVKGNCPSVKFIMKNDEDSIVHIPWLLERLQKPSWNSKIIGPYYIGQIAQTAGKFGVDPKSYPFQTYPPHVKGTVYIMPASTAYKILEVSEYMPFVNMEDAHITGILAKVVGASHQGIPAREYSPYGRPGLCDIAKRKRFAGRDLSASYLRTVWNKVLHPETC